MTTDERSMLIDSARRYVAKAYDFEQRNTILSLPTGADERQWQAFAEMGWLALGVPEAAGGLGTHADQAALAHELGRALVAEPWLGNTALCAPLLSAWAPPLAAELASGQTRFALAAWETQGRHDAFDVRSSAQASGPGWVLNGSKTLVLGGAVADRLLVLARTSGQQRDTAGLSLFCIAADAPGVQVQALPTYDGAHTARVSFQDVVVGADALLGPLDGAWPQVEAAIDTATVMQCAMSVGTMEKAFELTKAYVTERTQFGRALSSHQVMRHRLVDMYVAIAQARAVTEAAAQALDAPDATPLARRRAVSIAKAFISKAGRAVGEDAVQLHGAIGMTDEVEIGHCYKKLAAFANRFGDVAWHLDRLARNPQPA